MNSMSQLNRKAGALARMQTGTYGTSGEVLTWTYYDQLTVPATAQNSQMFVAPLSATKTLAETNMVLGGQLPNGQHFTITHVKVKIRSKDGLTAIADENEFFAYCDSTIISFVINNKAPMFQMKLSELLGLSTMAGVAGTGLATLADVGAHNGMLKLHTPISIGALAPFKVEVYNATAPAASVAGDFLTVCLCGRLTRAL